MNQTLARCVLLLVFGTLSARVLAEDPKIAYWLHCAGCHLLDGTGAPPEVPTLIDEPGRIAALPGGREYLIRIPGVAQAGIGDVRLAEVLNYVLDAFSPGTRPRDFEPYTAEEVGRLRQSVLPDPLRRRAEIVGD
jgi:hypothetical protein